MTDNPRFNGRLIKCIAVQPFRQKKNSIQVQMLIASLVLERHESISTEYRLLYSLYTSPVNSVTTGVSRNKVDVLENASLR